MIINIHHSSTLKCGVSSLACNIQKRNFNFSRFDTDGDYVDTAGAVTLLVMMIVIMVRLLAALDADDQKA